MKLIIKIIINTLAVLVAAYILRGVEVESALTALITAIVIGMLNTFIKPVLTFLTLPINIITLGLFSIVINVLIVLIASWIVPGFIIGSLIDALLFSIILSVTTSFLGILAK